MDRIENLKPPFTWPPCRFCGSYMSVKAHEYKREGHYICRNCNKKFVANGHPVFFDEWRNSKTDNHGNIFYITENCCYPTLFGAGGYGGYIVFIDLLGTGLMISYKGLHKSQKSAKEAVNYFSENCEKILSNDTFLSKYSIPKELLDKKIIIKKLFNNPNSK